MTGLEALLASDAAVIARKRPLPLTVAFAPADGVCATLEGDVRFRAGDAIVRGVDGETWPVARAVFLGSYAALPPLHPGDDGTYVKRPVDTRAVRLDRACNVPAGSEGDLLRGSPGDWLLRYADGSYGVVGASVFDRTYDVTGPA